MPNIEGLSRKEKKSILVVDDELSIGKLLKRFFVREGYQVLVSSNGKEAMGVLDNYEGISLAILDLQMPEMGGLETLSRMRQRGMEIPVIIMTGGGSHYSLEEARRLKAFAYLLKPFELSEIKRVVEEALQ